MGLTYYINRDAAFREFSLDHYKHFECWPMSFEYDEIVYDSAWVWGQLEEFNFFDVETPKGDEDKSNEL